MLDIRIKLICAQIALMIVLICAHLRSTELKKWQNSLPAIWAQPHRSIALVMRSNCAQNADFWHFSNTNFLPQFERPFALICAQTALKLRRKIHVSEMPKICILSAFWAHKAVVPDAFYDAVLKRLKNGVVKRYRSLVAKKNTPVWWSPCIVLNLYPFQISVVRNEISIHSL